MIKPSSNSKFLRVLMFFFGSILVGLWLGILLVFGGEYDNVLFFNGIGQIWFKNWFYKELSLILPSDTELMNWSKGIWWNPCFFPKPTCIKSVYVCFYFLCIDGSLRKRVDALFRHDFFDFWIPDDSRHFWHFLSIRFSHLLGLRVYVEQWRWSKTATDDHPWESNAKPGVCRFHGVVS